MKTILAWLIPRMIVCAIVFTPAFTAVNLYQERGLFTGLVVGAIIMLVCMLAFSAIMRQVDYPVKRFYFVSALSCLFWLGGLTGVYLNM